MARLAVALVWLYQALWWKLLLLGGPSTNGLARLPMEWLAPCQSLAQCVVTP